MRTQLSLKSSVCRSTHELTRDIQLRLIWGLAASPAKWLYATLCPQCLRAKPFPTCRWPQIAGVREILTSVVQALSEDPDRRFSWADMSFFIKWVDLGLGSRTWGWEGCTFHGAQGG